MSLTNWKLQQEKRWKICVTLKTISPLHIGSGEPCQHKDITNDEQPVDINACIKGKGKLPIIPGSTIKGKFYQYLQLRVKDIELLARLFGQQHNPVTTHQGRGGKVEFHDAYINETLENNTSLPYWNNSTQTYIETSTVIERHSKTALEQSLHYTECVPAGVSFRFILTGVLSDIEAGMLLAVLDSFSSQENTLTFGADDANGFGRMEYTGSLKVQVLSSEEIAKWMQNFNVGKSSMAMESAIELKPEDILTRIKSAQVTFVSDSDSNRLRIPINLKFADPFLVNDPYQVKQLETNSDTKIHHSPLLDGNGNPRLPSKSFRGALRAQAERIIRTMGGTCCDTSTPCNAIYKQTEVEKLCLACQVFGTSGWKTLINIEDFVFKSFSERKTQDFVAIDRFHGGGKDGAKFAAKHVEQVEFKGAISFSPRMQAHVPNLNWGKGLLALVLRDLDESDINFGYGASKGYGGLIFQSSGINFDLFDDSDIGAFRDKVNDTIALRDRLLEGSAQHWYCDDMAKPKTKKNMPTLPLDTHNNTQLSKAFHNPYHFIPTTEPETANWLGRKHLDKKSSDKEPLSPISRLTHSHAFYRDKTDNGEQLYHGRITCSLTTETPLFIGAQKDNSEPAIIDNYTLNGEIALPATSLRGMISSLAEAASNSSMRVLGDGLLSYRKPIGDALSAIGMIIVNGTGDNKEYHLIPLTLPTLKRSGNSYNLQNKSYQTMFPSGNPAKLKVYLNNEFSNNTPKKTWTKQHNKLHFLELANPNQTLLHNGINDSIDLRKPKNNNESSFVIGQKPYQNAELTEQSSSDSTPGILRIFGEKAKRNDEIPDNKKHELFIPIPHTYVQGEKFDFDAFKDKEESFKIPQAVIDRFEELAKQRTQSEQDEDDYAKMLPYHLKGMQREPDHTLKLKEGDLVYFRPNENNPSLVEEVSFSSAWRGRVEVNASIPANVYQFIPSELLPFNKDRKKISPTELLFGFAEVNEKDTTVENALAFAGKVRISAGTLTGESKGLEIPNDCLVTLKALSSPKLPSPSLYFQSKNNDYIEKKDLEPKKHDINGRKYYLHALRKGDKVQKIDSKGVPADGGGGDSKLPWETQDSNDKPKLKVQIKPIPKNNTFKFHLDFNNLTEWELGLMCYALTPTDTFHHRLGMGKPLGLGSVKIKIQEIQTIKRQQRYAEDELTADRYNQTIQLKPEQLRNIFCKTMNPDIEQALNLVGNPKNIKYPVHYPQVEGSNIEDENFKWFVANDHGSGTGKNKLGPEQQSMEEINRETVFLPTLTRHRWNGK